MTTKETFSINSESLMAKIKELIKEGNVTRIIVSDKMGKDLLNFPLTVGVFGVLIAPMFAAVGALAAIVTECTITVEREVADEEEEVKTEEKPL
ncbi:MAG: DUF4342 domain-containing protein [Mucilaginibacter sp.]